MRRELSLSDPAADPAGPRQPATGRAGVDRRNAIRCGEESAIAEHKIVGLDHIAVAVRDLEEAIAYFRDALGMETVHTEEVPGQKARIGFIPLGDTNLELVQPTDPASGLAKFIEQRGEGLHHICLEVRDIHESLKHCEEKGLALIDREPRTGAHHKQVAFLHPRSTKGILIELCQPPA